MKIYQSETNIKQAKSLFSSCSLDAAFCYRMLDRLKTDAEGFLSNGNSLWGGDSATHANALVYIWNALEVKPDWFTAKEVRIMTSKLGA